jgi:hypothetical protein
VSGGLVIVGHDAGDRLVPGTWKDARTPQPHHRFEGLSDEVGWMEWIHRSFDREGFGRWCVFCCGAGYSGFGFGAESSSGWRHSR